MPSPYRRRPIIKLKHMSLETVKTVTMTNVVQILALLGQHFVPVVTQLQGALVSTASDIAEFVTQRLKSDAN